MTREIIVDSFAGGGGASEGIRRALGRSPDIAINHDEEAIALHVANHPESEHYAEDVWKVDPVRACRGRPVGLMWLSPDCKDFSKAKGGKPVSKKIRGLAWVARRWAKAVRPRIIVLENVEEFQGWGPLLANGKRDPARAGHTFRRFVASLRNLGYDVEWREMRACDYGAPTIRKRLFLIARCDGKPIRWPKPTHGPHRPLPWKTAAECIDWSIPCHSIFLTKEEAKRVGVKRPLAPATMKRIARGVVKFVINNPRPFIVGVGGRQGQSPERGLDKPLQTITSKGDSAIVTPYLATYYGPKREGDDRVADLEDPLRTQSTENRFGLVTPYLVPMQHDNSPTSVDDPLQTITTQGNKFNLVAPTLIQTGYGEDKKRNAGAGQPPRSLDLQKPLGTVVGGGVKHALVAAFLAKHFTGVDGAQLSMPMPTVTSIDHNSLVTAHIKRDFGTSTGAPVDSPLPTITSDGGGHASLVASFLTAYYGNEKDGRSLFDPMPTVVSKERFALVTVNSVEYVIADIAMRMLVPRELYRAQGFFDSYVIDIRYKGKPLTKKAQVRMVGNSVSPDQACAIVLENVELDEGLQERAA
jgi:DNA (cytosine-5)-methyltransferase 1